jgi:hypothetical protein
VDEQLKLVAVVAWWVKKLLACEVKVLNLFHSLVVHWYDGVCVLGYHLE